MQNLFSYPLKLEDMSAATQTYHLEADAAALKFIAQVLKLPSVNNFKAEINVRLRKKEHLVDVYGFVDSVVEHTSVISLERFEKKYHTDFSLLFDTQKNAAEIKELDFDFEDDVPDILENGQIDLAAIAMEQLALVLDDFPRQEGEVFEFRSEFDEETTKASNPFAVLKKLKK